jgi:toxin-antitoxin system PIN domain toxin
MFLVDTNVFVHAAIQNSDEHAKCLALVSAWRTQKLPWYTTWGVLYEFMRVVTHPRACRKPVPTDKALEFVHSIVASRSLTVLTNTERHESILAHTLQEVPGLRGNLMHDLHTVVIMREHGIRRIVTRDSDFHRFDFLEVIDPLKLK